MNYRRLAILKRFYSSSSQRPDYDVIISGGGMIGSVLACSLANAPALRASRILLIEGGPKKPFSVQKEYSNRVSALSPGTRKLFKSLGIWNHIENVRYGLVKKMQVWGSLSDVAVKFESPGGNDVAYIVENNLITAAAGKELEKLEHVVTVLYNSKAKEYRLPGQGEGKLSTVILEDGKKYTCSILVGADGMFSKVRDAMNAQCIAWSYNQAAVVATLKLEEVSSNTTAWQRFLPNGPVALLPLNETYSSLVWSTKLEEAKELLEIPSEDFVRRLNKSLREPPEKSLVADFTTQAFEKLAGTLSMKTSFVNVGSDRDLPPLVKSVQEGSRASFTLSFGHAPTYVGQGVALIGDAAHRVHPLAGQGVNLGYGDVDCLTRVLSDGVINGERLGSLNTLKEYESERQRRNLPMMLAIDLINKIYSTTPLLSAAGNLAIQVASRFLPIRNTLMDRASSLSDPFKRN